MLFPGAYIYPESSIHMAIVPLHLSVSPPVMHRNKATQDLLCNVQSFFSEAIQTIR